MARHNRVNIIGYLVDEPEIMDEGTEEESIILTVRTIRRSFDGLHSDTFQTVTIYYDDMEDVYNFMELSEREQEKIRVRQSENTYRQAPLRVRLQQLAAYDLIEIKGVFLMLGTDKTSVCPDCECEMVKTNGSYPVIYPLFMMKLQSYAEIAKMDKSLPDALLRSKFAEFSNSITIEGTVIAPPEMVNYHNVRCCRYKLVVDRKFCIPTQMDIREDYPYVYSYGKQAEMDMKYLQIGAVVLVDGFLRVRAVESDMTCSECGLAYTFDDVAAEIVPYSVEYQSGHLTDEDIARIEEEKAREALKSLYD